MLSVVGGWIRESRAEARTTGKDRRLPIHLVAALVLAGCCHMESRSVAASGRTGAAGMSDLEASVSVNQERGSETHEGIAWTFTSARYVGHISSVALFDDRDSARVLASFPITAPNSALFSQFMGTAGPAATLKVSMDQLHDVILAGHAAARATTDLGSPAAVYATLQTTSSSDWSSISCGNPLVIGSVDPPADRRHGGVASAPRRSC